MDQHTTRSRDGTVIAYERSGSGPPVILVGGAFSYRAFPKNRELAELLAADCTVINYDRRGRVDSTDEGHYSVDREIDDLDALVDEAGGSASMWGWSSGAVLALRAAARGVPVDKLVLFEPPFLVDDSRKPPAPDFADRLQALVDAGDRSRAARLYMTEGMGIPRPIVAAMRLMPFWKRVKAVAHTLPYDWEVMGDTLSGRPLDPAEWTAVTAPTLVVAGQKSPQQLHSAALAVTEVLPQAEHKVLEGQSHNPSMKAMAPVVAEFVGRGLRSSRA